MYPDTSEQMILDLRRWAEAQTNEDRAQIKALHEKLDLIIKELKLEFKEVPAQESYLEITRKELDFSVPDSIGEQLDWPKPINNPHYYKRSDEFYCNKCNVKLDINRWSRSYPKVGFDLVVGRCVECSKAGR